MAFTVADQNRGLQQGFNFALALRDRAKQDEREQFNRKLQEQQLLVSALSQIGKLSNQRLTPESAQLVLQQLGIPKQSTVGQDNVPNIRPTLPEDSLPGSDALSPTGVVGGLFQPIRPTQDEILDRELKQVQVDAARKKLEATPRKQELDRQKAEFELDRAKQLLPLEKRQKEQAIRLSKAQENRFNSLANAEGRAKQKTLDDPSTKNIESLVTIQRKRLDDSKKRIGEIEEVLSNDKNGLEAIRENKQTIDTVTLDDLTDTERGVLGSDVRELLDLREVVAQLEVELPGNEGILKGSKFHPILQERNKQLSDVTDAIIDDFLDKKGRIPDPNEGLRAIQKNFAIADATIDPNQLERYLNLRIRVKKALNDRDQSVRLNVNGQERSLADIKRATEARKAEARKNNNPVEITQAEKDFNFIVEKLISETIRQNPEDTFLVK